MADMRPVHDIPLLVTSDNSSSERRITPSWTIAQLKAKLEPITGIPPSSQKITLRVGRPGQDGGGVPVEAADEENMTLQSFPLAPYAELHITDTRPPSARPNLLDPSTVEKYTMPLATYESKTDSVLSWKKTQKLGRFDPTAPAKEAARLAAIDATITGRGIEVGKRCRVVGAADGGVERRGEVMYVGDVKEIPGGTGKWVGVRLDEPVGKNDGSVGGRRYWGEEGTQGGEGEGGLKFGVFVRPERVEVGEFPVVDDLGLDEEEEEEEDEDMEEI